jgi:glycosyltransferase involved in cell wall biosynthesis
VKVAIVTPYHRESEAILRQCHNSVLAQDYPCEHIMVADGHARAAVNDWQCHHITLPRSHGDNGNTPRTIGSLYAINQGFDAIAYCDADNWYRADHIDSLVAMHRQDNAPVCASGRSIHRLDGSKMADLEKHDSRSHIDTSCLFLTRAAFHLCSLWALMPQMLSPICDRIFYSALVGGNFQIAYTGLPTLAFRSQYARHYKSVGESPPDGAKEEMTGELITRWNGLGDAERQMYFRRLGFSFTFGERGPNSPAVSPKPARSG